MSVLACPNCRGSIPAEAAECARCGALFGGSSTWKPVPRTSLARVPSPMTLGDFVMFPVQFLLSTVCLVFGFAVLFGEWHWGRPLASLFFLGLGMAVWVNLFSRRLRSVLSGLLMVAFGMSLLYVSVLSSSNAFVYPMDCSEWRRPLGCYFGNALHAAGDLPLVRAFWALVGVASLVAGVQFLRGDPRWMRG